VQHCVISELRNKYNELHASTKATHTLSARFSQEASVALSRHTQLQQQLASHNEQLGAAEQVRRKLFALNERLRRDKEAQQHAAELQREAQTRLEARNAVLEQTARAKTTALDELLADHANLLKCFAELQTSTTAANNAALAASASAANQDKKRDDDDDNMQSDSSNIQVGGND
jgi:DNA repair exonuclease SbcCD ATPase subunit